MTIIMELIIPLNKYKQNNFCLDDIKLIQLSKAVLQIEKYYSNLHGYHCPVDVEWAIDGLSNKLYIVQAKTETIHSQKNKIYFTLIN